MDQSTRVAVTMDFVRRGKDRVIHGVDYERIGHRRRAVVAYYPLGHMYVILVRRLGSA